MSKSKSLRNEICFATAIVMVFLILPGCSKRDVGIPRNEAPVQPAGGGATDTGASAEYKTIEVSDAATIRGTIQYTGTPPARAPLTINSDKEICGKHKILSEDLIVSSGGGVRNAVVWLVDVKEGKAWSDKEITQDQAGCVFTPHVVVVGVNQPIKFANSDPVVHNVRSFPRENLPLNFSLLAKGKGKPSTKSFILPDEMKVACDSHKWMNAWVIVRDNPYYAITGDDGSYQIDGVPPGSYTVVYWHESLQKVEAKIDLAAGQTHVEDLKMESR